MIHHILNKKYLVEVLPPKQDSENLEADLKKFCTRYRKVIDSGYCVCITDNTMGNLSFQGTEIIEEFQLSVLPKQVMIHLNTFHRKDDLDNILTTCHQKEIEYILVITGDGSPRLPKLRPEDVNFTNIDSITSVELLSYIHREYPGSFCLGVAFNPYEPEEHELEKMARKIKAGAKFIITQPIIGRNKVLDKLINRYPQIPVIVEAWMSKNINLLSQAVGYEIGMNEEYDPIANLKLLHKLYPGCGFYLSLLGFKTQYDLLKDTWI